jgi:aspartokinase-like uncharacterized kinase
MAVETASFASPGGRAWRRPMADAVRAVDRAVGLPDAAAHWMAVMAMDQYGEALASHMVRGRVVHDRDGIDRAIDGGDVPVLAPHAWLRQRDPVPHAWSVTSDSIAAWVAGEVGPPARASQGARCSERLWILLRAGAAARRTARSWPPAMMPVSAR